MRILFTSDWQAAWANLDKCQKVVEHIMEICRDRQIKTVVHLGDFKQHYNPLDVRVTNFAVKTCHLFKKSGIQFIILKGNHDRTSMSDTQEDWFPPLRHAGATVFSKPRVYPLSYNSVESNPYEFVAVPYHSNMDELRETLKKSAKDADPDRSILLFHNEVVGCKANFKAVLNDGVRLRELYPSHYMYCLGGHIHMRQRLRDSVRWQSAKSSTEGRVYYIGSPFCQDWGEANQEKGFTVIDLATRQMEFIPSRLPRYYDPAWPGFPENLKCEGAVVRVHVNVPKSVTNVGTYIEQSRTKAEAKYHGAEVVLLPEFEDDNTHVKLSHEGSDLDHIKYYVEQTCPEHINSEEMQSLLAYYLTRTGALQSTSHKIQLISARGYNFLSFKEVDVSYQRSSGITVVTGSNLDWHGRNNGSGKTSYLQLPAVALFGQTLKGQQNNRWVRRNRDSRKGRKQRAFVELKFKAAGKVCKILRGRNPVKLEFIVNGRDHSTGIGVRGTQSAIEQYTGLSWESLSNAMYIDQREVSQLLTGTDAIRKTIFSKFLSLDRFNKARDLLRERLSNVLSDIEQYSGLKYELSNDVHRLTQFIDELPSRKELRKQRKAAAVLIQAVDAKKRKLVSSEEKINTVKKRIAPLQEKIEDYNRQYNRIREICFAIGSKLEEIIDVDVTHCPGCLQPVDKKLLVSTIKLHESKRQQQLEKAKSLKERRSNLEAEVAMHKSRIDSLQSRVQEYKTTVAVLKEKYSRAKEKIDEVDALLKRSQHWQTKREYVVNKKKIVKQYLKLLRTEQEFIEYAMEAFSKNGLPMFIAGQLCPRLNKAAKFYASTFSEDAIRVKFTLTDDSVDVSVVNIFGGERVEDQSQGELRIAALIVGFALREVMSPCNLMVLDEPGESLDAHNAKVFAQGLREISSRLGPVMVTTHNPYILSELENEHLVEIVKRNGVSKAVCQ